MLARCLSSLHVSNGKSAQNSAVQFYQRSFGLCWCASRTHTTGRRLGHEPLVNCLFLIMLKYFLPCSVWMRFEQCRVLPVWMRRTTLSASCFSSPASVRSGSFTCPNFSETYRQVRRQRSYQLIKQSHTPVYIWLSLPQTNLCYLCQTCTYLLHSKKMLHHYLQVRVPPLTITFIISFIGFIT